MPIASINPANGKTIATFEPLTKAQLEEKLQLASETFQSYRRNTFAERAPLMFRAAEILESEKRDLARTMTLEMGKPINAAVAETEKCAFVCRYYAEHAERYLSDQMVATNASRSFVRFQPIGAVLAGLSIRRARSDGGQCRAAETFFKRAAVCAGN